MLEQVALSGSTAPPASRDFAEELVLSLRDEKSLDAFAAEHHISRARAERAVHDGLERAVAEATAAGDLSGFVAALIARTSQTLPPWLILLRRSATAFAETGGVRRRTPQGTATRPARVSEESARAATSWLVLAISAATKPEVAAAVASATALQPVADGTLRRARRRGARLRRRRAISCPAGRGQAPPAKSELRRRRRRARSATCSSTACRPPGFRHSRLTQGSATGVGLYDPPPSAA